MRASAQAVGLPVPSGGAILRAIAEAAGEGAAVRITLYDVDGSPALEGMRRPATTPEPARLISLPGWYSRGYQLREHKLTSHFHGVRGRALAIARGADDALLVERSSGLVGEATNANVVALIGDVAVTPPVDGLLPGVTRSLVVELLPALGIAVEQRPLLLDELTAARGVLLTTSLRGLVPALSIDGQGARPARCRPARRARRGARPRRAGRAASTATTLSRVAVAVRSGSRVLVEALTGSASPTDVLRAVRGSGAFLLEDGTRRGWSYLAPRPRAVLERRDPVAAFSAARALLDRPWGEAPAGAPPFWGGIAGSFGYDLARGLEDLPSLAEDDLGLPVLRLHLIDELLAFDHRRGIVLAVAPTAAGIRRLTALYEGASHTEPVASGEGPLAVTSFAEYEPLARRVLEHIGCGDVYQANLTHRISGRCSSAIELYAALREGAPVPYNLFLDGERFQLAGASPETFLRMQPDGSIETRPIKGTAPRSDDPARDRALATALAASPKDRAENTMIVDLARNDLSRVCEPGSVRVSELCAVEAHPTVHQMVSTIEGRLRPGVDALDAIAAAFPPGSMTGCPKVRAMQVIEQLEPVRRGPYAGAFGWIAPDGACDLAVVIRTAVVTAGSAYLHVGGAIVADSDARSEHDESLLKARTVARALGAQLPRPA